MLLAPGSASDYAISMLCLSKEEGSEYLYGVAEVRFGGSGCRRWPEVGMELKSSAGETLLALETYLQNPQQISVGLSSDPYRNTNAFVSAASPVAYATIIGEYASALTEIASVNVLVTDSEDDCPPPVGSLAQGEIAQDGDGYRQAFTNDGSDTIQLERPLMLLADAQGRLCSWTTGDIERDDEVSEETQDIFGPGQGGEFSFYQPRPSEGEPLFTPARVMVEFDGHDPEQVSEPWPDLDETPVAGPDIAIDSALDATTTPFTAVVTVRPGATGAPIVEASFLLNDVAVAPQSADQGAYTLVLDLLPGRNQLAVSARDQDGATKALVWPLSYVPNQPSSRELIDAALAQGTVSSEEALVYRVFALNNDPRLPQQYRSFAKPFDYDRVMTEAVAALPTLSEAAKDQIGPYLFPDFYWDASTRGGMPACNPLRMDCPVLSTWESLDGEKVRVWYDVDRPGDQVVAWYVRELLEGEQAAQRLETLMNRAPLSDANTKFNGGDGRLDIIMADMDEECGLTVPSVPQNSPVYIRLNRNIKLDSVLSNAVHEYMHAIQFATPLHDGRGVRHGYPTLSESMAVWASHYILSAKRNYIHHEANLYLYRAISSGLLANVGLSNYGAWLFLLYLENQPTAGAGIVRTLWDAASNYDEKEVFIKVLDNPAGRLEELWSKFATALWNRGPVKYLKQWDNIDKGISFYGQLYTDTNLSLEGVPQNLQVHYIGCNLPFLGAKYTHFEATDPSVRSLAVINGLTHDVGKGSYTPIGVEAFTATPAAQEKRKGVRVVAITEINGAYNGKDDWDWTFVKSAEGFRGYRMYCRERAAERLNELLLVTSFADPSRSDGERCEAAGTYDAMVFYSNVFCEHASGGGNLEYTVQGETLKRSFKAESYSFKRKGEFVIPDGRTTYIYGFAFELQSGEASWEMSGTVGDCSYSGSGSRSVTSSDGIVLATFPFSVLPYPRTYAFTGFASAEMNIEGQRQCPNAAPEAVSYPAVSDFMFESTVLSIFNTDYARYTVDPDGLAFSGDGTWALSKSVQGNWSISGR